MKEENKIILISKVLKLINESQEDNNAIEIVSFLGELYDGVLDAFLQIEKTDTEGMILAKLAFANTAIFNLQMTVHDYVKKLTKDKNKL